MDKLDAYIGEAKDLVHNNGQEHRHFTLDEIFSTEITDESNIPPIEPIIEIAGSIFATSGDFSVIGGLPKAGKTATAVPILATALMQDVAGIDTLGIRTKYCEGKPVIYIDTEQSLTFTNTIRKRVKKMIGCEKQPANLHILNWKHLRYYQMRTMFKDLIEQKPDIHLIIVDGIVDFVKDPNNTEEGFATIEDIQIYTTKYNLCVIAYIHENPGAGGKLRGNIGSQAERKCVGCLTVRKDKQHKGVHLIEPRLLRASADFDPIPFTYDAQKGLHVTLDPAMAQEVLKTRDKDQVKREKRKELARRCLLTGGKNYRDLVSQILQCVNEIEGKRCSERTASTRIDEMQEMDIIEKKGDFYHLVGKDADI